MGTSSVAVQTCAARPNLILFSENPIAIAEFAYCACLLAEWDVRG